MNLENNNDTETVKSLEEWYREEIGNKNRDRYRKKRKRDNKYKRHLKFLAEYSSYPHPAYAMDKNRDYIRENICDTVYYRRAYRGNHKNSASFYYKRRANRMVRRYKDKIQKGGSYRKVFDYWWIVY